MRTFLFLLVLVSGVLMFREESFAQTTAPFLRIETGMHIADIRRIGVDAANRYLVTCSDDKTIRVWELPDGKLLRTIRPPIDVDDEGKMYSVAISPDGKTIACGGYTQNTCIYIFDRATGSLTQHILNVPQNVLHLAYSKDGKYLAAALWGTNGLRIFRASDYSLIAEDTNYASDSYGVTFDNNNRLATCSYDGYIRLYSLESLTEDASTVTVLKPVSKAMTLAATKGFSVAFSPDGKKIAVGFEGVNSIDVFAISSDNMLHYAFSPDNSQLKADEDLIAVAWSADGTKLFAAGGHASVFNGVWRYTICRWDDAGKGTFTDLPAATNLVSNLVPLSDGSIAYCAKDPMFGILSQSGENILSVTCNIADYNSIGSHFLVSADAKSVQFSYVYGGRQLTKFSITDRQLVPDSLYNANEELYAPNTTSLPITDWSNTLYPKLDTMALPLYAHESARSLAIAPDARSFLLGSDWQFRLFDAKGTILWSKATPEVVWGVNISQNGKIAVAAFGDGTIKWYRMSDGQELLSFFPHHDKKRWVLWTPSGYYDASAGGEDLIGWHMNNGNDKAADFFPASKFRATYYRPDVVSKILETLDEDEAVRQANDERGTKVQQTSIQSSIPPVIQIVNPVDGSEVSTMTVTLKYSLRSPSGEPVTGIKAMVNGRPMEAKRGVEVKENLAADEINVTIPAENCEVSLIAENKYAASDPSTIRLVWKGQAQATGEFVVKPKLYVLAVGVSDYQDKELKLELSAKDATDFSNSLKAQEGKLYREVDVKLLTDSMATKGDILDGLDWIQKQTTSKDIAMIFLSGHGMNDQNGLFYYLPADVDLEKLKRTGLAFSEVTNTVSSIAGKVIVFADACHSGNITGGRKGVNDVTGAINELASSENGAIVFTSSTGKQYSLEKAEWGNGAFTKALLEGIQGGADYQHTGRITVKMLDLFVSERVKELTDGKQAPTTVMPPNITDFPVVVK